MNRDRDLAPRGGIAKSLVILFFMFGIIPLSILTVLSFSVYFKGHKQSLRNVEKEIVERISNRISTYLKNTRNEVKLYAEMLNPEKHSEHSLRISAYRLLDFKPEVEMLTVVDTEGHEICKVSRFYTFRPNELANISQTASFRAAVAGDTHCSSLNISGLSGLPHIHISVPIFNLKNQVAGVLEVDISIPKIWEFLSQIQAGSHRYAYLVDADGVMIAYQEMASVLSNKRLTDIEGVQKFIAGDFGVYEYNGLHNEPVIGANAKIPLIGWGVIVEEPLTAALRDLYLLTGIAAIIFLVTASLAVFMGIRFSFKHIVNPIRRLQAESELIAKGDFSRRIEVTKSDELGQLSATFNRMITNLQQTTVSRDLLIQEIVTRKQAEEELRVNEEKYRVLFYNDMYAICIFDLETLHFLDVNDTYLRLYGYSRDELLHGMTIHDITVEHEKSDQATQRALSDGTIYVPLRFHKKKDGIVFPVEIVGGPYSWQGRKVMFGIAHDITDRIEAEIALEKSLQDKEVLLREIHHRVKNNMQVINSLLSLQIDRTENQEVRQILIESRQRVLAMATLHSALFRSQDLHSIDLSSFINELTSQLQEVYAGQIKINVKEEGGKFEMGMDQAVPCGLIINELVTNAFKHAFPDGKKGEILIRSHTTTEKEMVLTVSDDGVGLPPGMKVEESSSLGLRLVNGLLRHQLKGCLTVSSEKGTAYTLRWPLPPEKKENI
jgi:PAS domain S-box-containing protein